MSPTSYQAAPPRVSDIKATVFGLKGQPRSALQPAASAVHDPPQSLIRVRAERREPVGSAVWAECLVPPLRGRPADHLSPLALECGARATRVQRRRDYSDASGAELTEYW